MTHICVEIFLLYFQNKRVTAKDMSIVPGKEWSFPFNLSFCISPAADTAAKKRGFKGKRGTEKSIHVTFTDVLKVVSKLCMWELKSCKTKPQ